MTTAFAPQAITFTIVGGDPWWTCPDWCDRRCAGGWTVQHGDADGWPVARVHTLHRFEADGIKVVDEQVEDADTGYGKRTTVLYVDHQAVEIGDPEPLLAALRAAQAK